MAAAAKSTKPTVKPKGQSQAKRWFKRTFSHKRIVTVEALLLIGLGDRLFKQWLLNEEFTTIPPAVKILILMFFVVGVFGSIILTLQRFMAAGLDKGTAVVQAIPLPTPTIVIHVLAFFGLFLLYGFVVFGGHYYIVAPWFYDLFK